MSFGATVLRVLIASPGDTAAARQVVREVIDDWNSLNAEESGVILLPVAWERDATPQMGDRPQGIINRQLVDVSDILVGTFWTRLGTPTSEAESGTTEEIERFIGEGKPVLLYFSNQPVAPDSVEQEQLSRLRDFRQSLESRGLYDNYADAMELWRKLPAALSRTIRDSFGTSIAKGVSTSAHRPSAELLAQVERDREMSGFSSKGKPQYRTRHKLIITNNGSVAAEDVVFRFEGSGREGEALPRVMDNDKTINKLAPGGSLQFPVSLGMGMASQWDIVLEWHEGDTVKNDRQTLR